MTSMARVLLLAAVTFSLAGAAVPPRRGPVAIGSAKEDECPAVVETAGRDVAYLRAVGFAFEPAPQEIRAQAIEDLGFLGDPRALNALAVLSLDPNPVLSRAAIRAVATIRHPRAEEILGNIVRHPTVPSANRQMALSLLPFQNTVTALRTVHHTATLPGGHPEVMQLARALAVNLRQPTAEEAVPAPAASPPAPATDLVPAPFPGAPK